MEAKERCDQRTKEARKCDAEVDQKDVYEVHVNLKSPQHRLQHRPEDQMCVKNTIKEQEEETLIVVISHTIVDPRTMVIHLQDAPSANTTMVSTIGLVPLAMFAVPPVARFLRLLQVHRWFSECSILAMALPLRIIIGYSSRVYGATANVAPNEKPCDHVEGDDLDSATPSHALIHMQWILLELQHRDAVTNHVYKIKKDNNNDHEEDWSKFFFLFLPWCRPYRRISHHHDGRIDLADCAC